MAKRNLKDFITDDTLDLSLNDLTDVPVKEIAAYPKVTILDLSNNNLKTLSKSFAVSLNHLVKLDLARNELKELPINFGLLVNLKHLDLYKNKLQNLPLSFGNLKALRWLDLKENPLDSHWQQIAGPCLNADDCKKAARNVVNVASIMKNEVEAEVLRAQARQKQQEENEENEQRELAKKREKQREKKRRRNAAKAAEQQQVYSVENGLVTAVEEITPADEDEPEPPTKSSFSLMSFMETFLFVLLKVLLYSTIITATGIYLLQFVNEPLYKDMVLLLSKQSQKITSLVPGHWRVSLHKITLKILNNVKIISFNIWTILYKISVNTYTFVVNDPRFELYLNSLINSFLNFYVSFLDSFYKLNVSIFNGILYMFNTVLQIFVK